MDSECLETNPFLANVLIYTPSKHQKTKGFYGIFRGYKMGALARNGLYITFFFLHFTSLLEKG